jgi:broad specificity phosphatase PhoE
MAASYIAASKPPMATGSDEKRIVFVRHGCTYMNEFLASVPFEAPKFSDVFQDEDLEKYYHDSPLSPRGIKQAQTMLAWSPPAFVHDCGLVVTSPLSRALQTLEIGLKHHLGDAPIVALPHAAERLYLISDVGKRVSVLKEKYPYIDFSTGFEHHAEDWWFQPSSDKDYVEWRKTGNGQRYACPGEPQEQFDERMQSLVSWLGERSEQKIVVICHWGVIDWMLGDDFMNCQWRDVSFSSLRQHARVSSG